VGICRQARCGPEFLTMQRTRAAFKLNCRYCRQHEQEIEANNLAKSLADKCFDKFWSGIQKSNNSKTTAKINIINGCSGDSAIVEMWKSHFESLFNSVDHKRDKELFMQRISQTKMGQ